MDQMKLYYSAIIYIIIAAMAGLGLQIKSNDVLAKSEKKSFTLTMGFLVIVSLAEWAGVIVEGKSAALIPLHKLVKCIEFSLAPVVPITFIARLKKRRAPYFALFGVHAILEILSIPYGFIFDVDANNMYHRADFYWIYILFYVLGMILFLVEIVKLNEIYQGQNMASLVGIVFFLITGILFQIINRLIRTDWLTVAISLILLYAYYCNLVLEVDALTELLNRACYEKKVEQLQYRTAILMFDVDDFKSVNDTYGHQVGDEVLKAVAHAIKKVYSPIGYCYRIGGDEFCVILKRRRLDMLTNSEEEFFIPEKDELITAPIYPDSIQNYNSCFEERIVQERKKNPLLPEVSVGYAFYYGTENIQDKIKAADELMYQKKRLRKKGK